jgi:hypothetical protein
MYPLAYWRCEAIDAVVMKLTLMKRRKYKVYISVCLCYLSKIDVKNIYELHQWAVNMSTLYTGRWTDSPGLLQCLNSI